MHGAVDVILEVMAQGSKPDYSIICQTNALALVFMLLCDIKELNNGNNGLYNFVYLYWTFNHQLSYIADSGTSNLFNTFMKRMINSV